MKEVKEVGRAAALMNARLLVVAAEVRKERCEGLEADWTAVAEQLDAVAEQAATAARAAWRIVREAS